MVMSATAEQIARYIRSHPEFAPYAPQSGYPAGIWTRGTLPSCTAPELADELLEDVGFRALELGGFLSTPDGELIASGVELALPATDRRVVSLAVDALKLAATKQSELTPLQVGGLVVGGLALFLLLASG
jgi:hypothetical protein